MVEKKVKKTIRKKKKKRTDELHVFQKIKVFDSKQESLDISSRKEGYI